jgi:hypothetical protein
VSLQQLGGRYGEDRQKGRIGSRPAAGQRASRGTRQQHLCRFHHSSSNMSHTTQNTLYTSNCGGQRTIDRSSHAFVHAHRIIATTPGLGYPSNQGIQDMAMRDAQSFRYGRQGQELSANDTIWVRAMVADRSLDASTGTARR